MKRMRLAMCVAVFALIGGIAFAEDMDIRALQAKLAAQEARLNDLQAKMNTSSGGAGTADNVVSLRKNAKVTIGGDINTRIYVGNGEVKSDAGILGGGASTGRETRSKAKFTDFRVTDAKLRFLVDVNDHFEAFIRVDLQDNNRDRAFTAQEAYVRWKDICNSGFGVLVGRTSLVFGGGNEAGSIEGGWYGASEFSGMGRGNGFTAVNTEGMLANGSQMIPAHTGWDNSRTTQITPYWENADGTFKAELSYIQQVDTRGDVYYERGDRYYNNYRSSNDGFGSGSARITWKPIEGLKLVASAINKYSNANTFDRLIPVTSGNGGYITGPRANKNNTAVNGHIAYEPCFIPGFKIWAAYVHDWNAGYVDNLDADIYHLGASYAFADNWSVFWFGEHMRHKNTQGDIFYKSKGWASYAGLKWRSSYGINAELGWRYEEMNFKNRAGTKHTKYDGNMVYAHLGFGF